MNYFALASSKDCSSRLASNKQSAYLYLGTFDPPSPKLSYLFNNF